MCLLTRSLVWFFCSLLADVSCAQLPEYHREHPTYYCFYSMHVWRHHFFHTYEREIA